MNDELAVRVGDGVRDLQKQAQPRRASRALRLAAIDIERPALDVFDREIRLAVVSEAGVVEPRDVRMIERGEDRRARAPCALRARSAADDVRQLERDRPIDQAVDALGEPHRAHAAAAELAHQSIRRRRSGRSASVAAAGFELDARQRREKIAGLDFGRAREQNPQLRLESLELRVERIQPRGARCRRAIERLVEQPLEIGPGCGIEPELRHRAPVANDLCCSTESRRVKPDIAVGLSPPTRSRAFPRAASAPSPSPAAPCAR